MSKTKVAVMFGGRAPEHDVSVITGLQALQALDSNRYEAFPLYIALDGAWFVGSELRYREHYLPNQATRDKLTRVTPDIMPGAKGGRLIPERKGLFSKSEPIDFDVALLAFHGSIGEDGGLQGWLETAAVPYTGMRLLPSALFMDKIATKRALSGLGVPLLPDVVFNRPAEGLIISLDELRATLGDMAFPLCVKPAHLGSSIGVGKANTLEELQSLLSRVFADDWQALAEPFIDDLVEYNVAVAAFENTMITSAIEEPKRADDLLDFKQKYMAGGGSKKTSPTKQPGSSSSEGMLSLTRTINPELTPEQNKIIRETAKLIFQTYGAVGAPRLDFYGNKKTGDLWFNELNPCPGSFGFFLWEAAEKPILFSRLLDALINEALMLARQRMRYGDLVPQDARLLKR